MSYKKYYEGGWQSGETGGTPITPEALNHMEQGISDAAPMTYAKKVSALYNHLDNSYWENPNEIVNQRGAGGTYPAWGSYTIDRWFVGETAATITIAQNGITLKGSLMQAVSNHEKLAGKTITAAMKINGVVYCCSGTVTYTNAWHKIAQFGGNGFFISVEALDDNTMWFVVNGENGVTIEWAALYEGEYTAETLPEYQPKGYAAELAECRRYFRKYDSWDGLCTGYIDWQHHLWIFIPTDIPMRVNPTCSNIAGSIVVNGTYITLDTTPTAVQRNGLIALSFPGFQVAADHGSQPATIVLGENGLTLSADL